MLAGLTTYMVCMPLILIFGQIRGAYLGGSILAFFLGYSMMSVSYTHLDVYKRQLLEIDRTAQERMDTMLPHMMEAAGVTEELKACDPMRWVGLMNTLTAQIEEILIWELICS